MSLKNQIAIVTGASRGLGRGIAIALGREGATVYITGIIGVSAHIEQEELLKRVKGKMVYHTQFILQRKR
jgi:NAD(P)-dependent dehydrogenase (short-subunit alcohol dehydrogenase family)